MKLTTRQLRQIIKEEVQAAVRRRVLKEDSGKMAAEILQTVKQLSQLRGLDDDAALALAKENLTDFVDVDAATDMEEIESKVSELNKLTSSAA